jgi:hypothetical protein
VVLVARRDPQSKFSQRMGNAEQNKANTSMLPLISYNSALELLW